MESAESRKTSISDIKFREHAEWTNGWDKLDPRRAPSRDNQAGEVESTLDLDRLQPSRLWTREQFDIPYAEELQKQLPEILRERPDILQALVWDLHNNRNEIELMLGKLYAIKPKEGEEHPLKTCLRVLTALDAVNGVELKSSEDLESSGQEVPPFKNELLNLPEVWQKVSMEQKQFIDKDGKKQTGNFMVLEFRLSDVFKVDAPANATRPARELADSINQYMQLRYNWETNVFKDKTFKVIRYLDNKQSHYISQKLKLVLATPEGMGRRNSMTREECENLIRNKRFGYETTSMDDFNRMLGIDRMLTRDAIIVNADHGWCGDNRVNDTFIAQALHRINTEIPNTPCIAINSDNMGIQPTLKERLRNVKSLLRLRRRDNSNLADEEYRGLRHDQSEMELFTQKEYGRDIFWKLNTVFGILGSENGKTNRVLTGGWSFGGGATIEAESLIIEHADKAFRKRTRENIAAASRLSRTLEERLGSEDAHDIEASELDWWNEVQQRIAETLESLKKYEDQVISQDAVINGYAYFPDITSLRFAPAVEGSCIFLGQTNSVREHWRKAVAAASMGTVFLGNILNRKGLTKLEAGEHTLKQIARLYTGFILPVTNGQEEKRTRITLDEDAEAVRKMGEIHYLNYAGGPNNHAVDYQTRGLIGYKGLTDEQSAYIATEIIPSITFVAHWDRLVWMDGIFDVYDKRKARELCILTNSGHCVTASKSVQEFPYELLLSLDRKNRYSLLNKWKQLALLQVGLSRGKTLRDIDAEEYLERLKELPPGGPPEVGRILFDIEDIFPQPLKERAVNATTKYGGVMYCPPNRTS